MLVQYSDDEDDNEAPVLNQDPASNVKVTVHIPPPQPAPKDDEEEESYVNLDLVRGIKRPPITHLTEGDKGDSDSSDEDGEPVVKTNNNANNKKQKIETCNAIMPTASKTGRYFEYTYNHIHKIKKIMLLSLNLTIARIINYKFDHLSNGFIRYISKREKQDIILEAAQKEAEARETYLKSQIGDCM